MNLTRYKRRIRHRWTPESSAKANAAKRAKALESPLESRPTVKLGTILHRIQVESPVFGTGFEVIVKQGPRANQIVAETFGRESKPHGMDWLCRHLRPRLKVRWLPGTRVVSKSEI